MLIFGEFDQANNSRKKEVYNRRMLKAQQLNTRLQHFLREVYKSPDLKPEQKRLIKKRLQGNLPDYT